MEMEIRNWLEWKELWDRKDDALSKKLDLLHFGPAVLNQDDVKIGDLLDAIILYVRTAWKMKDFSQNRDDPVYRLGKKAWQVLIAKLIPLLGNRQGDFSAKCERGKVNWTFTEIIQFLGSFSSFLHNDVFTYEEPYKRRLEGFLRDVSLTLIGQSEKWASSKEFLSGHMPSLGPALAKARMYDFIIKYEILEALWELKIQIHREIIEATGKAFVDLCLDHSYPVACTFDFRAFNEFFSSPDSPYLHILDDLISQKGNEIHRKMFQALVLLLIKDEPEKEKARAYLHSCGLVGYDEPIDGEDGRRRRQDAKAIQEQILEAFKNASSFEELKSEMVKIGF